MTRDEVRSLLQRRLDLTGDNFNGSMLDAWHDELASVDYGEAVVAMRRAAKKGHVRLAQFHEALDEHQHGKRNATDERTIDCHLCDGSGWKEGPRNHAGNTSSIPCTQHVPNGPPIPYAQGVAIAAQACAEEMLARGRSREDIDRVLDRWFPGHHAQPHDEWGAA